MKKKNTQSLKENPSHPITASGLFKRVVPPIFWTAVILAGLWSLMQFSTPETKLEPYSEFNKTSVSLEDSTDTQPEPALERFADAGRPELADMSEFNKTSVSLEDSTDTQPEPALERFADAGRPELADMTEPTPGLNPPKGQLPKKTLEHLQKGMQLIEEGKYNSADMEFEKATQSSPDSPEVFALWGTALRVQEKYKGANRNFAKAAELAPNDEEIIFNWGVSRFREKAIEEAIKLFKKTVELNPNYFMGWYYLGKTYGQKNLYAEEVEYLRKVIELQPAFGWGHFDLGIALSLQKKFEEAAPHFEKAIEIDREQFEKPFVIQFLTALGRYNPSASKKEEKKKPEPVAEEAKADTSVRKEPKVEETKVEETKSEGSDHKMEGSKNKKETTSIKGNMLINGKPPGPNAVVFLETKTKMKAPNQKTLEVTIGQSDIKFAPKHSIIPVGSTVTFINQDMEVHNIYSKSLNNQFNLGAMAAGSGKAIHFTRPGPVVLRCNLHRDMVGTIFVIPNGYYTQPDVAAGSYEFKDVKSSGYILQAWAPHLAPSDVEANLKSADLTGEDKTFDFNIKTASVPEEIHDMVDPTDYNALVDNIEAEMMRAIKDWENGKKYISRKRMLMAITKYFDGGGLKGALSKSFSEKRSKGLEDKLDAIRKQISGIGPEAKTATGDSLRSEAEFTLTQLRVNVKELEARLNPDPRELKRN